MKHIDYGGKIALIKSLELKNIKCFQKNEFEFKPGLTVICGTNGSGKSTLLVSIAWIFADYLDCKLKDFSSKFSDKSSKVVLAVDNFKIMKSIPSMISIMENEESLNLKGLIEYKNWILNHWRINPPLFLNSTFLRQNQELDILMRPGEAKKFLMKLFELDFWKRFYERTSDKLSNLKLEKSSREGALEVYKSQDFDTDPSISEKIISNIFNFQSAIEKLESEEIRFLEWDNQKSIRSRLTQLYQDLLKHKCEFLGFDKDVGKIHELISEVTQQIIEISNQIAKTDAKIDQENNMLSLIVDGKCPTCTRPFSQKESILLKQQHEKNLEIFERRRELQSEKEKGLFGVMRRQEKLLEDFNKSSKDRKNTLLLQGQIEELEKSIKTFKKQPKNVKEFLDKARQKLEDLKIEKIKLKERQDQAKKLKGEMDDIQKDLKRLKLESIDFSLLRTASAEIPKMIADERIKRIQSSVNDSLVILSEDSMRLNFDDNFEISISHNGISKPYSLLSGGEQKRVKLAIMFGLSEYFKTKLPFLLLDEVDSNLDATGRDSLINLLESKRKEYPQIIMASHQQGLLDIADNLIQL